MIDASAAGNVIAQRLRILAELDESAHVSFMERSEMRLRVFGIVDSLDQRRITVPQAAALFEVLQDDVTVMVSCPRYPAGQRQPGSGGPRHPNEAAHPRPSGRDLDR